MPRQLKAKPLPPSLVDGLRSAGFREMVDTPEGLPTIFRCVQHPRLFVEASAPRTPGSTLVVARWGFRRPPQSGGDIVSHGQVEIDVLVETARLMVDREDGINQPMVRP
jgi:hypothetical protein